MISVRSTQTSSSSAPAFSQQPLCSRSCPCSDSSATHSLWTCSQSKWVVAQGSGCLTSTVVSSRVVQAAGWIGGRRVVGVCVRAPVLCTCAVHLCALTYACTTLSMPPHNVALCNCPGPTPCLLLPPANPCPSSSSDAAAFDHSPHIASACAHVPTLLPLPPASLFRISALPQPAAASGAAPQIQQPICNASSTSNISMPSCSSPCLPFPSPRPSPSSCCCGSCPPKWTSSARIPCLGQTVARAAGRGSTSCMRS